MTDDKQVRIKINYAGNTKMHTAGKHTEPQMVTEWNIKRIVIVFVILGFFVACGIYLWLGQNGKDTTTSNNDQTSTKFNQVPVGVKNKTLDIIKEEQEEVEKFPVDVEQDSRTIEEVIKEKMDPVSRDMKKEIPEQPIIKQVNIEKKVIEPSSEKKVINNDNHSIAADEPAVIETGSAVFPEGLMRAVITSSIWKKEPVDKLTSPIMVKQNRARSVFYFTELKGMKGETVSHVWKYKGKVKFIKKIKILGDRWRASTSKLMNHASLGDWSVQLTTAEGKVMNEINFTIIDS